MAINTARKRGRKPKLGIALKRELAQRWATDESVTVRELAAEYGISSQTLYNILSEVAQETKTGAVTQRQAPQAPILTETPSDQCAEDGTRKARRRAFRQPNGDIH